jgi:peptide deformylase
MAVRPLLVLGHPLLWTPSLPCDVHTPATRDLIADLGATLADFRERRGFGRAIAAPQVGELVRLIYLNVGEPRPMLNPRLTHASEEQMELWDDCFSFPDLMVRVRRSVEIKVAYEDEHGTTHELVAKNQLAELLQHELDHLDGILATDRAVDVRALAMRSEMLRRS